MWGSEISPRLACNLRGVRKMYTSSAGHEIVYNMGGKDNFQVSIIEKEYAYSMKDVDYFTIVSKYYQDYPSQIDNCLKWFSKIIDRDAGNLYDTFSAPKELREQPFNISDPSSFGYNNTLITTNLRKFHTKFSKSNIKDINSELEEALVIIYLAMISEWYYGFEYGRIDNGQRSIWQHRIKLLGLQQVLSGQFTPQQAATWSSIHPKDIAHELNTFHINNCPQTLN